MTTDGLPDLLEIASFLVTGLGADLAGAVERYRFLLTLDAKFGSEFVMLPGGTASSQAYTEGRFCYVYGNFLATIVLAQSFAENLLGSHLRIQEGIKPVHGILPRQSGNLSSRPSVREILIKSVEDGLIAGAMKDRIEKLIGLRNPLLHHRDVNDKTHIMRRSMNEDATASDLIEEDAGKTVLPKPHLPSWSSVFPERPTFLQK